MNDMSAVIVAKSDQVNADDLIAGPRVVTIAGVKINPGTEQPVQMMLEGTDKVFRPCKTVSRIIVGLWGPDANQYVGRSLRLFRDADVTWAGVKVGGIRVDQASHIDNETTLIVKESQKSSKKHKIRPLVVEQRQPAADPAAKWTANAIAAINDTADMQALIAIETKHEARLKELKGKRPELHGEVVEAIQAKARSFANDGTLADNPAATEGADDTQRGEFVGEEG